MPLQPAVPPRQAFGHGDAAHHDREEVVELVGDAARQLSDRLQFLGLEKLLARLLQRVLRLPLLGDVPRDLGETDERAGVVVHGIDQGRRPETAAVLAHAPALVLVPPGFAGCGEGALRLAVRLVLRREEPGERFPEYFLRVRSEEHTSELQSLMRISYAVFCL